MAAFIELCVVSPKQELCEVKYVEQTIPSKNISNRFVTTRLYVLSIFSASHWATISNTIVVNCLARNQNIAHSISAGVQPVCEG